MMPVDIADFRAGAKRRLPSFLFEYADGGAGSERTLERNASDLEQLTLRQRVLSGVGDVNTQIRLFTQSLSMPVVLAPVGMAGMYARRGEVQAARAAEAAGVPFTLSTVSCCTMEEVCDATARAPWFQLYITRDRGFVREMLERARRNGATTLVLTVDMPVPGVRYRDLRAGLAGGSSRIRRLRQVAQAIVRPRWLWDVGISGRPHTLGHVAEVLGESSGMDSFWAWLQQNFDPTVGWRDLEQIRAQWDGALVVKGILEPADAVAAVDRGADGVVVSNHGGRQLDGVVSSVRALPRIVDELGGRAAVLMDGGIRSGGDVVRAIASGADAVMIGRPWVWGLSAAGRAGVESVLGIVRKELAVTMALAGVNRISQISTALLADPGTDMRTGREVSGSLGIGER